MMDYLNRRMRFRAGISVVLIIFMMLSLITPNLVQAAPSPTTAKLSGIKGDVYVKKAGGQTEFKAFDGMVISQGDWIRTGESASAQIVYENGAETVLAANSQVTVNTLTSDGESTQSSIKLWAGNVWNKVKRLLNINDDYEVETPTAVMGVRGTLYLVSIDPETGETRVDVMDGAVAGRENTERTSSGQEYVVSMGEQVQFDTTAAAPPASQAINIQDLVESVEPRILAKVMTDVTERVSELVEQAKTAQATYQQTLDVGQIQSALSLARQSSVLAEFAQSFVSQVQTSPKATSVEQTLQETNTNLDQLKNQITTTEQDAKQTETQIRETASEVLTEEQIEEILETAPSTIPGGSETPPPPPPSDSGDDEGDGGDGGSVPVPQNSIIAPTAAVFDKNETQARDIEVEIVFNGNTLEGIQLGELYLAEGIHYTLNGELVKLSKDFLMNFEEGEHIFTFFFSAGNPAILTIGVTDTTVEPPSSIIRIKNIEVASVSSDGEQGDDPSENVSISGDGKRVVFESWSTNLVNLNVTNKNIYLRDRDATTTTTELVNLNDDGEYVAGGAFQPKISADGNYVVFETSVGLVPQDTNGLNDIYVKNLLDESIVCISIDKDGNRVDGYPTSPSISGDGRYVVFVSRSSTDNIYVYDRDISEDGVIIAPLDLRFDGRPIDSLIDNLVISSDGGFIVFESYMEDLIETEEYSNGVFVYDLQQGKTTLVGLGSHPDISAYGRYITFEANDDESRYFGDLIPEDNNGYVDILVVDRGLDQNGIYDEGNATVELISQNSSGQLANADCYSPRINADGRYIVYSSEARNLVPEDEQDIHSYSSIYLWDRHTGKNVFLSKSLIGVAGHGSSIYPVISADGQTVAFISSAPNLVPDDHNGVTSDVFVVELDLDASPDTHIPVFLPEAELKATQVGYDWAKLEWNQASDLYRVVRYVVLRATAEEGPYQEIAYVEPMKRVYMDTDREPGQDYYYRVYAANDYGNSIPLPPLLVKPPTEPFTSLTPVPLAAGSTHSLAKTEAGKLLAWGKNDWGQLGIASSDNHPSPVYVVAGGTDMSEVAAIAANEDYSVALKHDGTVWTWGKNVFGQLGIGNYDYSDHPDPVQVEGLKDIVAISAGNYHVLALQGDGTVWAWGSNNRGCLGDGTPEDRYTPVRVKGPEGKGYLTEVVAIAAGANFSLALKQDGTVWAWGNNDFGQLGNSETGQFIGKNYSLPQLVKLSSGDPLSGVVSISAGYEHALALTEEGTVYAWGDNTDGQVGNDEGQLVIETEDYTYYLQVNPVPVRSLDGNGVLSGIRALAGGDSCSFAIDEANKVLAWGDLNRFGLAESHIPTAIDVLEDLDIDYVVSGSEYSSGHILALDSNGVVWALGYNGSGQLGNGETGGIVLTPVAVVALKHDKRNYVDGGEAHSLFLQTDGTVLSWGTNDYGQLGNGISSSTGDQYLPAQISGLDDVASVAAGDYHSLALKTDGTVWSWGRNWEGQLGLGEMSNITIPTQIPSLSGVEAIAAGSYFSLALKNDGTVWAWGDNSYGQLGNGSTESSNIPIQVLSDVKAIAAGDNHSLAIKQDGTVWAWGDNGNGQTGNGNTAEKKVLIPIEVNGLSNIVQVAGGYLHSLALTSDGEVYAWGSNGTGQLGQWTDYDDHALPIKVADINGVTSIAAGWEWSLAVKGGEVYTWGDNGYGQLGDGSDDFRTAIVKVVNPDYPESPGYLQNVKQVAAGRYHNLAINNNSEVLTWGYNNHGQLGIDGYDYKEGVPINPLINVEPVGTIKVKSIELANVKENGERYSEEHEYFQPGISGDGQRVVFIAGLDYYTTDVFVFDREQDEIELQIVNQTNEGEQISGSWVEAVISDNGQHVAFQTDAALIDKDKNALSDIYVRDLEQGKTVCITLDSDGQQIDDSGTFTAPSISGDGRYVAFLLYTYDTPREYKVYIHDRDADDDGIYDSADGVTTKVVDLQYNYQTTPNSVTNPKISKDGRFLVVDTWFRIEGIDYYDVFVHDLNTNKTISAGPGWYADMSANGRFVAMVGYDDSGEYSYAENILVLDRDPDGNGRYDEDNTDIETITVTGINENVDTIEIYKPKLSGNGRYVVYEADTMTYADEEEIWEYNIYLYDRETKTTTRLSSTIEGEPANGFCERPVISSDGKTVAFESLATNLADNTANGLYNVLVLELELEADIDTTPPIFTEELWISKSGLDWVELGWGEATDNNSVTKYALYRGANPQGPFEMVAILTPSQLSYMDTNLLEAQYYYVAAYDYDGNYVETAPLLVIPGVSSVTPEEVPIAAGYYHSLAVTDDGRVLAWGDNSQGQLGIGDIAYSTIPEYVLGPDGVGHLSGVVAVAAHEKYSLALKEDGTVWAWGHNKYGVLGLGEDVNYSNYPVRIKGQDGVGLLTDIIAIAAGEYHVLALAGDGKVWSWGSDSRGSLGNGTGNDSYTPSRVRNSDDTGDLDNIKAIAAGGVHSMALDNDGKVWTWGTNGNSQLGYGEGLDWLDHPLPQKVLALDGETITNIGAGRYNSFAISNTGEVWAWGNNYGGALGTGDGVDPVISPTQISTLNGISAITGGQDFTLAIDSSNSVWGWGVNDYGQLGRPVVDPWSYPTPGISEDLPGLRDITHVAAGEEHTLTIDTSGRIWALGNNEYGQLGIGTYGFDEHPVPVNPLPPETQEPIEELYRANPDVAYDPANDRYLVVYEKWVLDYGLEYASIYGRFIDANGNVIGEEFLISDGTGKESTPKVAFNSGLNTFLAAWSSRDMEYPGYDHIEGRIIDATSGAPSGAVIQFNETPGNKIMAVDVAASEDNFLVVWGQDNRINGNIVNEAGSPVGGLITIEPGPGSDNCDYPSVAYGNGQYLLAYQQNGNSFNIKTTFISKTGVIGQSYLLTEDNYDENDPEVIYLGEGNFMVSWEDIDATGKFIALQMVHSTNGVADEQGLFERIELQEVLKLDDPAQPVLGFSESTKRLLVAWVGVYADKLTILGRIIIMDESMWTVTGELIPISQGYDTQLDPVVAIKSDESFIIIFSDLSESDLTLETVLP